MNDQENGTQVEKVRTQGINKLVTMEGEVQDTRFMYTNIDYLISKKLQLEDYIRNRNPEIECLTGTKVTKDDEFPVNNYHVRRKDKEEGKGGGVMIMISCRVKIVKAEYRQRRAEMTRAISKEKW